MKLSLKKALFMFVVGLSLAKVSFGEELPAPVPEAQVIVPHAENKKVASLEEEDFAGTPTPAPAPGGFCSPDTVEGPYIFSCARTNTATSSKSVTCPTPSATCRQNIARTACVCK